MLEDCLDLIACELRLERAVKDVFLLGEIPLSDDDIDILANFIRQIITPSFSKGTNYLKTKAPTCFVCFLVSMGRYYDKQAGYWPIVEEKIGTIDLNWKVKWGKIFLQYLGKQDLPKFDEEEGLAYVTPILGHACIPDCCIDEYFQRVVAPLVNRDLLNPLDQSEIIYDLRMKRKINESRLESENKTKKYVGRIKALQQEKRRLQKQLEEYEEVESLLAEEDECERRKITLAGLENAEQTHKDLISCIKEDTENIQGLELEGKRLWRKITNLERRYQPILAVKSQIDDAIGDHIRLNNELPEAINSEKRLLNVVITEWGKLSKERWNDSYCEEILGLPFDQLLSQIEQIQYLLEQQKTTDEKITNILASQIEEERHPSLISTLVILIRKTLAVFGKKTSVTQPSELERLQSSYSEIQGELQRQLASIKLLFVRLPIEERLLQYPSIDLHQELCSLKLKTEDYLDSHKKQAKLEEEKRHIIEQVKDFVSSLHLDENGNLIAWIDRLREALKDAGQNQAAALEAKDTLEKEIRPALEAARLERRGLQADLEKLEQRLAELGDGSTQLGLSLVQEFHQFQEAVAQIRQNLSSHYPDFAGIESELQSQGWEKVRQNFEETVSELGNRIQSAKGELKQIQREAGSHPIQFFGTDEPIRRFLLYGGTTAESYLIDSVLLFTRVKSGERLEDISDLHLPNRIIQNFQQWWESYRTSLELKAYVDEEINLTTGERFRGPQIFFEYSTGEVIAKLPSQRFLRPDNGMTVQLDVYSTDLSSPIYTVPLNLYHRSRGLVETHSCEDIVLTSPSEKYIFRMKSKDSLIHEWEIPGPGDVTPYLIFSASSHKLIKGEHMPRSPLIIVVNEKFRIHPQECILTERGFLVGGWTEYAHYEVDLSAVEEFCLIDPAGQSIPIPLASELGSGILLIGGNQITGVLSDERQVFNLSPEIIRIPIKDRDSLNLLSFSLFWEDENRTPKSKHYQVSELVNLLNLQNDGWIDIPLNDDLLLGTNPIGCFTLRVYRPPYLNWQLSFCIIPQLNASFDQEIYLPYREKIPDVIATLSFPENSTFRPDSPAKLVSRDRKLSVIQTPASEHEIIGMFLCSTDYGESINIPITFFIPKLRWRLQGLDDPQYDHWFDEIQEELWIGDWIDAQELFLIVETPWFYSGDVTFALLGSSILREMGKVHDRKARVDLKALEDALFAGPPLETVTISLNDIHKKFPSIPLFTVCTCWIAEKIRCFHYPKGDTVQLDVSWKEKGKANQKVARLWYLSDDRPRLIQEQMVPQDVQETTFRSTATEIKSGKYLIHLEPSDPWSSRPICPKLNDKNVAIFEIVTKTTEKSVIIRSVGVDERHRYSLPKDAYRIQILGKVINQKLPDNLDIEDIDHVLIAPLNENWYVGNLEVTGIPEVITHLSDTNPVKFEYDSQLHVVTSIEDRHREGAMYCYECNMLFWYQETNLEHKHKTYGPIVQFGVVWESE